MPVYHVHIDLSDGRPISVLGAVVAALGESHPIPDPVSGIWLLSTADTEDTIATRLRTAVGPQGTVSVCRISPKYSDLFGPLTWAWIEQQP